jgi:shikimate kinase
MRIHLLGFMGAGKSSLGPVLAGDAGLDFLDLDREIESREGKRIPELFAEGGEERFRRAEHSALADLAERKNLVLATGGGVVERSENHSLLAAGFTVYLSWPWPLLRDRLLFADGGDRPLTEEGGDALKLRWQRRDPIYRQLADLVCELGLKELRTPRRLQFPRLAEEILTAAREAGR